MCFLLSVNILVLYYVKIIFFNILILYAALHKKLKQIMARVGKKVADPSYRRNTHHIKFDSPHSKPNLARLKMSRLPQLYQWSLFDFDFV